MIPTTLWQLTRTEHGHKAELKNVDNLNKLKEVLKQLDVGEKISHLYISVPNLNDHFPTILEWLASRPFLDLERLDLEDSEFEEDFPNHPFGHMEESILGKFTKNTPYLTEMHVKGHIFLREDVVHPGIKKLVYNGFSFGFDFKNLEDLTLVSGFGKEHGGGMPWEDVAWFISQERYPKLKRLDIHALGLEPVGEGMIAEFLVGLPQLKNLEELKLTLFGSDELEGFIEHFNQFKHLSKLVLYDVISDPWLKQQMGDRIEFPSDKGLIDASYYFYRLKGAKSKKEFDQLLKKLAIFLENNRGNEGYYYVAATTLFEYLAKKGKKERSIELFEFVCQQRLSQIIDYPRRVIGDMNEFSIMSRLFNAFYDYYLKVEPEKMTKKMEEFFESYIRYYYFNSPSDQKEYTQGVDLFLQLVDQAPEAEKMHFLQVQHKLIWALMNGQHPNQALAEKVKHALKPG